MLSTEPLGTHGERVIQVDTGRQHGANKALLVQFDDGTGVRFDKVALRTEDQHALPLFHKAPASSNNVFALVSRKFFPPSAGRSSCLEVSRNKRLIRSKGDSESRMVFAP